MRLPLLVALSLAFFLASGCDDPASAGLDLIEEDARPLTARLAPEGIQTRTDTALTGTRPRILAGGYASSSFGTVYARAHTDFAQAFNPADVDVQVERVTIELPIVYAAGDTTTVDRVRLFSIPSDWDANDRAATEEVSLGDEIQLRESDALVEATDSLLVLELPSEWVADNDELLVDTSFADAFHGFALDFGPDAETVYGFQMSSSGARMTAYAPEDTLRYVVQTADQELRTFTYFEREDIPDAALVRDGALLKSRFELPLPDSLLNSGLGRFGLTVYLQELEEPAGVALALPDELALIGIRQDGTEALLASGEQASDPTTLEDGSEAVGYLFSSSTSGTLRGAIQQRLLDEAPWFDAFEVRPFLGNDLSISAGRVPDADLDPIRAELIVARGR